MEHPNVSVTDNAKKAIHQFLAETDSEPLSVVIVWASPAGKDAWWWSVAFHRTSELDSEYRFKIAGIDFYCDGPFYTDERALNGKTIDFSGGVFNVG